MSAPALPLRILPRHWTATECMRYYLSIPFTWIGQFFHNGNGIAHVLDITRFRPMPAGLVGMDHPWVTGLNPATGRPIWFENILYRSRRPSDRDLPEDDEVVGRTGQFLANMVAQSAVVPELPWGPQRPMPHGINYIHGSVHYNSGILVFTDFADAIEHFTDPRFAAGVRQFVRVEHREVLLLFREREYSTTDYAYFVGCMRTLFPWFCNSNGPKKRVLWGNPAPFPAANLITGNWIRDVYRLRQPGGAEAVVRPPIAPGRYLAEVPYQGWRRAPLWPEKLLARWTYFRIRMRGSRGGLYFVDRRALNEDHLRRLARLGIRDEPIARI